MSLYESRGNLHKAFKELGQKWLLVKSRWNDEQARTLETDTLEPLERDVRIAGEAMDSMKNIITAARRDCSAS